MYCELQNLVEDILRVAVDVERFHLGAMDHDVGDLEIAQIKHAAEHLRIVLQNGAFFRLKIDGAADLFMRGQDVGGVVLLAKG